MAPRYSTHAEARAAFEAYRPRMEQAGIHVRAEAFTSDEFRANPAIAMDAQPHLSTVANSGIPVLLATTIDPEVIEVLFAPLQGADILGERKKGNWLSLVEMFPMIERVGEVSSYGDYSTQGMSNANLNWPSRESYLFQTIIDYGERESEMAGLANVNWVSELQKAAALTLNTFQNLSYFFGVAGIANYGLINQPGLSAALTPGTKANGGVKWIVNGRPNATANEVYDDIVAIFSQLVLQTFGLVDKDAKITIVLSPGAQVALTFTNSFGVSVTDLVKKNFPNITFKTATQFGAFSTTNNTGNAAGELVMMIATSVQGQDVGYMAYNEKMRAHQLVPDLSSWKQKHTSGTWGAILRMPVLVAQMVGV
jgi:hypothetical protein